MRRRVEAEAEKAGYVQLVNEELYQLVGGQKLLLESELTKLLKLNGLIREVQGIVEVAVQTMDGSSFNVTLEEGGTVADLKSKIQEAQGAALYRQQLFMLGEGVERGSEVQEPLSDDYEIKISCAVMLSVQVEEEWSWDSSSPLLERKEFELRVPNNSVAAKIDNDGESDNCMMARQVIGAGTGKHIVSMQLESTACAGFIMCGAVSDGEACNDYHGERESTVGWFMTSFGGLCGNGKEDDDEAGRIDSGDVLTMQADTDAGTLKFWVNGEPHGPGYTGGVRGPLRWATSLMDVDSTVAIVPTPTLQPWSAPPDDCNDDNGDLQPA